MSMYTTAQLLGQMSRNLSLIRCFCVSFSVRLSLHYGESLSLTNSGTCKHGLYVSPIVSGEVIRSRGGSTLNLRRDMSSRST